MARHKVAKCRPGLLHPVLSSLAQTVPLIAPSGPESCTIVHGLESPSAMARRGGNPEGEEGRKAKDAGGMAASNYYRERASPE